MSTPSTDLEYVHKVHFCDICGSNCTTVATSEGLFYQCPTCDKRTPSKNLIAFRSSPRTAVDPIDLQRLLPKDLQYDRTLPIQRVPCPACQHPECRKFRALPSHVHNTYICLSPTCGHIWTYGHSQTSA